MLSSVKQVEVKRLRLCRNFVSTLSTLKLIGHDDTVLANRADKMLDAKVSVGRLTSPTSQVHASFP